MRAFRRFAILRRLYQTAVPPQVPNYDALKPRYFKTGVAIGTGVLLFSIADFVNVQNMKTAMETAQNVQKPLMDREDAVAQFFELCSYFRTYVDWNWVSTTVSTWLGQRAYGFSDSVMAIMFEEMPLFPEFTPALFGNVDFYLNAPATGTLSLISAVGNDPTVSRMLIDDDDFLNNRFPEVLDKCPDPHLPLALISLMVMAHPDYFRLRVRDSKTGKALAEIFEQYEIAPHSEGIIKFAPYMVTIRELCAAMLQPQHERPLKYAPAITDIMDRAAAPNAAVNILAFSGTFLLSTLWMRFRAKSALGVPRLPPGVSALVYGSAMAVSAIPLFSYALHRSLGPCRSYEQLWKCVSADTALNVGYGLAALMLYRRFRFLALPLLVAQFMTLPFSVLQQMSKDMELETVYMDEAKKHLRKQQ